MLRGPATAEAARRLRGAPGVEQVAPFGASLHVVGREAETLGRSVRRVAAETGAAVLPAETSLENVFISLMGETGGPS